MVHALRGGAYAGVLAAVTLLLIGCDGDVSVAERIEMVDAIADRAAETELGRMHELAAREDATDDELRDGLVRVMDDLESPADVADIVAPSGVAGTNQGTGPDGEPFLQVARAMVVVPEADEPFCAVIGLGIGLESDGTAAGTLAHGDVDDDCRDAEVPVQEEDPLDGNPLALSPQDSRWLDQRDPRPN